jgi:cytochrome c1
MRRRAILLLIGAVGLGACALPTPTAPPDTAVIARGQALFQNKGCATCHVHRAIAGRAVTADVGPDLSAYRNDPAFLRAWLADPQSIRPETDMPKLPLSEQDIEELILFINAEH